MSKTIPVFVRSCFNTSYWFTKPDFSPELRCKNGRVAMTILTFSRLTLTKNQCFSTAAEVLKKLLRSCFQLGLLLCMACSSKEQASNPVQVFDDYILIEQNGGSYENGYLHGSSLRAEITQQLNAWQSHMGQELGLHQDSILAIVYQQTGFLAQIKRQTPDLLEEINGIADGAAIDRRLLLAYNLGEEIYNYRNRVMESCSNLAVQNQENNILTYNQDLPDFLRGDNKPVILKHKQAYVFAMPGTIGISGVSKTVAVSCNSLPMLKMNENGLALSFIIRKLLACKTYSEVEIFLHETSFAIPQNMMLASAQGVTGFEASGHQLVEYGFLKEAVVYHTNFPMHNLAYKYPNYKAPECIRFAAIDSLVRYTPGNEMTDEILRQAFGKYPLLNKETYLRFTVIFKRNSSDSPEIIFINPKQTKLPVQLSF